MIKPYKPMASAKIITKTIPTYSLGDWPTARTPASPTIPMANPEARELNPQHNPAQNNLYPTFIPPVMSPLVMSVDTFDTVKTWIVKVRRVSRVTKIWSM